MILTSCFTSNAQLNESEIKAAYLLNFLNNLTFENQANIDTLRVIIIDDDNVLNTFKELSEGKRIKSLPISSSNLKSESNQLVYIAFSSQNKFRDVALTYQKSVVVSNLDHYLSDIQFIKNPDQSIGFSLNAKNLNSKKIQASSELLVYNKDRSDVLTLIEKQQQELEVLILQSEQLSKDLESKETEVNSLNKNIEIQQDRLSELNNINESKSQDLKMMQNQIDNKENELNSLISQFNSQHNELSDLKEQLNLNYQAIDFIIDSVAKLELLLDIKKDQVKENEALLLSQQNELNKQERTIEASDKKASRNLTLLLIAGSFTIILIILLYFFGRENKAKKEALITIEKQNKSIQEASKLKDEFISNLSHEVRSPLNAIIGYADLIHESIRNPETKKNIEYITMSSRNLLGMINDILDYRKIESGKGQLDFDNFELESVVTVVFNTLKITAENKGLEYNLIYDPELPQFVNSDPKKISQILLNLIGNAIKFTSDGKVEVRVRKISEENNYCKVRFCVSDTGIGIDKTNQKLIFETFTQETDLTAKEFGGSGLGLSISRKLIELFGGTIQVDSEPGSGAVFSFILDMKISNEGDTTKINREKIIVDNLEKLKILVVDDLLINRNLLLKQFELRGCRDCVETAENGLEALDMISKKKYDIILTDIRMPVMNGVELARILRKNGFTAPIIGVSANDQQSEKKECLSVGMNGYIVKPYSFDALLIEIADVLYLKYHKENQAISPNVSKNFNFERLRNISESEEEFETLKNEILDQVKQNLHSLNTNLSVETAHENVNKAAYFGNEEFLNLCRDLESKIRNNEIDSARSILKQIEESLIQNS